MCRQMAQLMMETIQKFCRRSRKRHDHDRFSLPVVAITETCVQFATRKVSICLQSGLAVTAYFPELFHYFIGHIFGDREICIYFPIIVMRKDNSLPDHSAALDEVVPIYATSLKVHVAYPTIKDESVWLIHVVYIVLDI